MSIYLIFLAVWAASVALSVWRNKALYRALAASAAVGVVFVAPAVLVGLDLIPGWGFAVFSAVGYGLYWLSDVLFEVSPYEESKAA